MEDVRECAICTTRKHDDEFCSMARYGCTCATPVVCSACTLRWFCSNDNGSHSFEQWSCPVCRGRTRQKTEFAEFIQQRFPRDAAASRASISITSTFTATIPAFVMIVFIITCIINVTLMCFGRHLLSLSSNQTHPSHTTKYTPEAASKWTPNVDSICVAGECTLLHLIPNIVINTTDLMPAIVDLSKRINN